MPSVKAISKSALCYKAYKELGEIIPVCINHGCIREVAIRHWIGNSSDPALHPSLKTECSTCSNARIKEKVLNGITFHKKNYCENKDSVLGFKCPMDPSCYAEFPGVCYDMDHIDGNHNNNTPENLMTICKICHARKGKESGDFNSQKKSSRKPDKKT